MSFSIFRSFSGDIAVPFSREAATAGVSGGGAVFGSRIRSFTTVGIQFSSLHDDARRSGAHVDQLSGREHPRIFDSVGRGDALPIAASRGRIGAGNRLHVGIRRRLGLWLRSGGSAVTPCVAGRLNGLVEGEG